MRRVLQIAVLLTACQTKPSDSLHTVPPAHILPPAPVIEDLPAKYKDACPALPEIKDPSVKAIVEAEVRSTLTYSKCKKAYEELVETLGKIKEDQQIFLQQLDAFQKRASQPDTPIL